MLQFYLKLKLDCQSLYFVKFICSWLNLLSLLQFELVKPTSMQSMIVGATIMMIISYIFIPNFVCSLWVAFCIISIEVGVAGYMALWNVNLDCISMINLIMCIGYSVDFTAHICYAYMSSKQELVEDRVKECLYSLGLPIFQGSVSTILGVAALIFAQSYIFLVFFKMIFLVIFFGALHGMFLLPVLLSWFGPGSCRKKKPEMSEVEKTFPHPYCIPHPSLHPLSQMNGSGKHFGVPLHGMADTPRIVMSTYNGDTRGKFIVEGEKDLGLGTSGEDSSESSSSKSQRRKQEAEDDEVQRRRYVEGWRKSSVPNMGPNRTPPLTTYHNGGYMSDEDSRPWRGHPASNQSRPRSQHYSPRHNRPYSSDVRYP